MAKRKDFCLKFQISHIEFGGKILQYASNFFSRKQTHLYNSEAGNVNDSFIIPFTR